MSSEKRNYKPLVDYVKKCIRNHTRESLTSLSEQFGVPRTTIYDVLVRHKLLKDFLNIREDIKMVVHEQKQKGVVTHLRNQTRDAIKRIHELETELEITQNLSGLSNVVVPEQIEIQKSKGQKEAVAFTLASDWHYGEVVESAAVSGINSYNLDIAKRRTQRYFERTLKILNMCKKESHIERLVIGALGDFISGWIHEDLISSTTPPKALVLVFEQWVSGLTFLAENSGLKELIFVGVCGNHGRITAKTHFKKREEKNYEWLLYQFLAKYFMTTKYSKKIKFLLPTGYFNWLKIYDKVIRFHHGDGIRYQGGVGGLHIPLRKAIAQWNMAKRADLDLLGHWHTRKIDRNYVVNGSLIGYNEFAQAIKADYEPPAQCFFILHPKYEKTAEFAIMVN